MRLIARWQEGLEGSVVTNRSEDLDLTRWKDAVALRRRAKRDTIVSRFLQGCVLVNPAVVIRCGYMPGMTIHPIYRHGVYPLDNSRLHPVLLGSSGFMDQ